MVVKLTFKQPQRKETTQNVFAFLLSWLAVNNIVAEYYMVVSINLAIYNSITYKIHRQTRRHIETYRAAQRNVADSMTGSPNSKLKNKTQEKEDAEITFYYFRTSNDEEKKEEGNTIKAI